LATSISCIVIMASETTAASCHGDELIRRESTRSDRLMKMLFMAVTLSAARQRTIVLSGRMSQAADRESDDL
jgi:hypothetical protein